jgi:hypothetical protein
MPDAETNAPPSQARGAFDLAPFRLGFGCASLGSRISAEAGLRALHEAHERGVNWFDVAPAYGAGEAEAILSRFVKARRDRLLLTTKVGIAPPARLGAMRLLYAAGRPVIGALSGLRRAFRKVSATRNVHVPLTATLIEESICASLARLGTDHVDVYALHDPDPADVARDEVLRALEAVKARGQARLVAVAGKRAACEAAARVGAPYDLLQMSVADLAAGRAGFAAAGQHLVAHSIFGVDGLKRRLDAALAADPAKAQALRAAGYDGPPAQASADLLIDCAFALNPTGVVLASMFDARHRAHNLARALRPASPLALDALARILPQGLATQ